MVPSAWRSFVGMIDRGAVLPFFKTVKNAKNAKKAESFDQEGLDKQGMGTYNI